MDERRRPLPFLTVSIIVPTLDEEVGIREALTAAIAVTPHEIIVVDGGSADRTRALAEACGCRVLDAPRSRAVQMNAGARAASGDLLLFLHADTRLPPDAIPQMAHAMADEQAVGGRFDVSIDGSEPLFRVIETLMNLRSRVTRVATGDQAIFVRRHVFEALGGFAPIPLMEDVQFCARLKRRGRVVCLRARVRTSARRWRRHGIWRTMVRMWWLRGLYAAGVSPDRLARWYAPVR